MNKIAFISDIHGNYEALKSVLDKIDELGISETYCLGDVVGYYSQVNECCNELRNRNISAVMGNHDWYLAGGGFCPRSQSVNDCLVYQRKVITKENLRWIKTFPVQREINNIKIVHGGWTDPIDEYLLNPSNDYFQKIEGSIFLSGHTHLPRIEHFENKTYCNPGSVGQPRDENPLASFAVYDGEFTIHRVKYDMERVFVLMEKAGFEEYYYGCLETGSRNLCKLRNKCDEME